MPIYNFPINNGFDIREYTSFRDEKIDHIVSQINTYETIFETTGKGFIYNCIAGISNSSGATGKLKITIDGMNYITCKLHSSNTYCGFIQENSKRLVGSLVDITNAGIVYINDIPFNDDTSLSLFVLSLPIFYYQSFKIEAQSSSLTDGINYRYSGGNKA